MEDWQYMTSQREVLVVFSSVLRREAVDPRHLLKRYLYNQNVSVYDVRETEYVQAYSHTVVSISISFPIISSA